MTEWRNDKMTRNSQHGTQKPSAWYALGLKMLKINVNWKQYNCGVAYEHACAKSKRVWLQ